MIHKLTIHLGEDGNLYDTIECNANLKLSWGSRTGSDTDCPKCLAIMAAQEKHNEHTKK